MNIPIIDTKNSNTLQEKYNKKHYPEFYEFLNENYPEDILFREKLYWYFHNIIDYPICPICGKRTRFLSYGEGYKKHCSSGCASKSENAREKFRQTCLKKYGVDNPSKFPEVLQKIKDVNIERYGVEYHSQLESAKEQTKKTCQERYGGNAPRCSKKIQEKSRKTCLELYGNENYNNRELGKKTCQERYGVDNPMQLKDIQEKARKTNLIKYGCEYTAQNESVKLKSQKSKQDRYGDPFFTNPKKAEQTKLERYGDPHYSNREKAAQTCIEKYGVDHPMKSKDVVNKLIGNVKSPTLNKYEEIISWTENDYICKCSHPDCNKCKEKQYNIPKMLFLNRKYRGIETCVHLVPLDGHNKNTTLETFIQNILNKYNINYETGNRKILNRKELDIYIPEKSLAIECNGILWHSDKDQDYHFKKWEGCKNQNITLLTFWEDQIINTPDIIESILLSKFGIYQTKIDAGKCRLGKVPVEESDTFLSENHLQGPVRGSIRLGLYYEGELVSIMVFGKKRVSRDNGWELLRCCDKINYQIIGGDKRLFQYFIQENDPDFIKGFSSNDIDQGELYKKFGFKMSGYSIPYWYIDKKMERYHHSKFRKSELVKMGYDKDKTEFEITLNYMGLYRIYDTGQIKWVWTKSSQNRA